MIRDQDSLNDEKFDSFLDRLHNLNILYITDTRKVQDFDDQTTIETYRINRIKARMRRMEKGTTDVDNAIRSLLDWIIIVLSLLIKKEKRVLLIFMRK